VTSYVHQDWRATMARAVGIRIRESLVAGDVIGEARLALEQNIAADAVYLHLGDRREDEPAGRP